MKEGRGRLRESPLRPHMVAWLELMPNLILAEHQLPALTPENKAFVLAFGSGNHCYRVMSDFGSFLERKFVRNIHLNSHAQDRSGHKHSFRRVQQ